MPYQSKVAIVKVEDDISQATEEAIKLIGGLDGRIRQRDLVLVKPNFILAERSNIGTTTNLEMVRTVVELFKKVGAQVVIGEASANLYDTKQVWASLAVESTLAGYELRDLNSERIIPVNIPGAKALKQVGIAEAALKANYVVSLPVMKTHVHTLITGGMKNMMGALPLIEKWKMHTTNIHNAVVDLNRIIKPQLTVMDCTVAMEGMGPTWGTPVKMGLILAGFDVVALDTVAAALMGIDPHKVKHLSIAGEAGLGCNTLTGIEIVGEPMNKVKRSFKRPRASSFFERYSKIQYRTVSFILKTTGIDIRPLLKKLISFTLAKPELIPKRCNSCQICVPICPTNAIEMNRQYPIINYYDCTRCMLCFQHCPKQAYQIARQPLWYLQLKARRLK